ncbi:MAG: chemotaxis protein CheW [Sulfuriflexus sp.]|nr:chemotaxis protein CheW [Sulfuriflexus sp.]
MAQVARHVASQILSLSGERVILPNTAVAEIIPYVKADSLSENLQKDAPTWLLGMIAWRGIFVPLLSMETMLGSQYEEPDKRSSIAIINASGNTAGVPFYAIVTQGIPRLLQVSSDTLSLIEDSGNTNKVAACHVVLDGDVAVIPEMDEVEAMLKEAFEGKKAETKSKKKTTNKKKKKK